jgi:hypothetical protein
MNEEELRQMCHLLMANLVYSQAKQEMLVRQVQEAAADGYRIGYGDAVADRALRLPQAFADGVEEGFALH